MQRIFKTTGKITDAMVDCIVRESNEDWSARGKTAQDIDECFRDEVERACANFQQGEISVAHIVETEFSFIDYVVCTISPTYQKSNPRTLRNLVNCYKNCMKLAELKHTLQIAFPVLGMGEGGYPMGEAVCAAITAAKEWIDENED